MNMTVVYTGVEPPDILTKSLFLAGPSPRSDDPGAPPDWRPEALGLLEKLGYVGVVFCPTFLGGTTVSAEKVHAWETSCLKRADAIVFWVPRDLEHLPGLTTNVEFGMHLTGGKAVLGYPPEAPKMEYLERHARAHGIPVCFTLRETLVAAVQHIGAGAYRVGGECQVPIHIWRTKVFQQWLKAQKKVGNRLDSADLQWSFRPGPEKPWFAYVLNVDVYVAAEGRNKTNEFIFSRPDIVTVVASLAGKALADTKILLVREFRAPVRNSSGFVFEVPGGSAPGGAVDISVAQHELEEETGLTIQDASRFRYLGSRQVCATLCTHVAHTYMIQLTPEEWALLEEQQGQAHGVVSDTERTFVEIQTVREILQGTDTDWSMVGMILAGLCSNPAPNS
jgi:8-oxo-dGTP pyrophosphatase MutT (NUDIX family)